MKNKTLLAASLSFGLGIMLSGCFHQVADGEQVKPQPVKTTLGYVNQEPETFEVVELTDAVLCARYASLIGITEGGDHNEGSEFIKQEDGTYVVDRFMLDGFKNGAKFEPATCVVEQHEVISLTYSL